MITTGTIITTVKTPSMVTRYIILEVEVECSMYSTSNSTSKILTGKVKQINIIEKVICTFT